MSFDIDQRTGWPEELRVLLKQYPRETWAESRSPLARFWLDKHDAFRHQSRALESATDDYRAERSSPRDFAIWIAPRLQSFISYLHGHHQIEDHHYFPAFRTAEPRLAAGFDALAKDHEMLSAGIVEAVEAVNQLIVAIRDDSDADEQAQRQIGLRYADTSLSLYRRLARHLDDEEDLIIPVMLEQG